MKKNKQKALSIMEILVSLMILALVFLGLLNLFISGRRYLQHSQSRMTGIELGKLILDPLQIQVRQDKWATNQLGTGTTIITSHVLNGLTYTATSYITTVPASELRRVQTKINWKEDN